MSSPVSTSGCEDGLERVVLVGRVGGFVLPAAPDHAEPGSGQDAGGMGVVLAAGDSVAVDLCGPRIRPAGAVLMLLLQRRGGPPAMAGATTHRWCIRALVQP